jgi:hypothetical protein
MLFCCCCCVIRLCIRSRWKRDHKRIYKELLLLCSMKMCVPTGMDIRGCHCVYTYAYVTSALKYINIVTGNSNSRRIAYIYSMYTERNYFVWDCVFDWLLLRFVSCSSYSLIRRPFSFSPSVNIGAAWQIVGPWIRIKPKPGTNKTQAERKKR